MTSLTAPRVRESGVPGDLPWREVKIHAARGKTLFGWFIPAGSRAPALAVLHGWGGNAEMMLPLAKPLHEAGYVLLFFDARCHGRSDGDNLLPCHALPQTWKARWNGCKHSVTWTKRASASSAILSVQVPRCYWQHNGTIWLLLSAFPLLHIRQT